MNRTQLFSKHESDVLTAEIAENALLQSETEIAQGQIIRGDLRAVLIDSK